MAAQPAAERLVAELLEVALLVAARLAAAQLEAALQVGLLGAKQLLPVRLWLAGLEPVLGLESAQEPQQGPPRRLQLAQVRRPESERGLEPGLKRGRLLQPAPEQVRQLAPAPQQSPQQAPRLVLALERMSEQALARA